MQSCTSPPWDFGASVHHLSGTGQENEFISNCARASRQGQPLPGQTMTLPPVEGIISYVIVHSNKQAVEYVHANTHTSSAPAWYISDPNQETTRRRGELDGRHVP